MSTPSYFRPTLSQIEEAMELDTGFCRACGAERDSVEPDAENYQCEECGAAMVFGTHWYVINGWITEKQPEGRS